jgi:hypothetical protein
MNRISERFLERCNLRGKPGWSTPDTAFRHHDLLGKCSVSLYTDDLLVLTDVALSGAARPTMITKYMGLCSDIIASLEAAHAWPYFQHLAAELMSHGQRGLDLGGGP